MNGEWLVDAVNNGYCSQMEVTGPSNENAWEKAQSIAKSKGVELNLGSCASKGYGHVTVSLPPKTFSQDGYVAKWDGQIWAK